MIPHGKIILVKYQPCHSYNFWTMPILILSPVQIIMGHPLHGPGIRLFKLADLVLSLINPSPCYVRNQIRLQNGLSPLWIDICVNPYCAYSIDVLVFYNSPLPLCIITPFGKEDKDSYIVVHSTTLVVGSIYGWSPFWKLVLTYVYW